MTTQDKLAEALLARIQKAWEAHSEDGKVSISMRDAMELCEQVLPTVIQQVQPPAVSVTDAMVERACKKYAFREDGAAFPDAYSDEEVLAERTLMREFLEHVLLAAQENHNG